MSNIGKKFNIITLCGSIRFKEEFLKVKEKLTLAGKEKEQLDNIINKYFK